jgi:inorganic pyrophosphatase
LQSNLEELPIGKDAPGLVNAVIEVPGGSRNKYEYDPGLGRIVRDRVLLGSVRYPADYGFVPSTLADDGDPLDVMVASYDPVFSGCVVRARPVGALHMTDREGEDYTVFALPQHDARFDGIDALGDLPGQSLAEIEQFFTIYKRLEGDDEAAIQGWLDRDGAYEIIRRCASRRSSARDGAGDPH